MIPNCIALFQFCVRDKLQTQDPKNKIQNQKPLSLTLTPACKTVHKQDPKIKHKNQIPFPSLSLSLLHDQSPTNPLFSIPQTRSLFLSSSLHPNFLPQSENFQMIFGSLGGSNLNLFGIGGLGP